MEESKDWEMEERKHGKGKRVRMGKGRVEVWGREVGLIKGNRVRSEGRMGEDKGGGMEEKMREERGSG